MSIACHVVQLMCVCAGVKVFGLSRTLDQNLNFYLYSEWEDQKAYGEHFKSDHVREYLEAIAKIGVVSATIAHLSHSFCMRYSTHYLGNVCMHCGICCVCMHDLAGIVGIAFRDTI